MGGGSIDPRMLHVLLINWLAFMCFRLAGVLVALPSGAMKREFEETQALEALLEPPGAVR